MMNRAAVACHHRWWAVLPLPDITAVGTPCRRLIFSQWERPRWGWCCGRTRLCRRHYQWWAAPLSPAITDFGTRHFCLPLTPVA